MLEKKRLLAVAQRIPERNKTTNDGKLPGSIRKCAITTVVKLQPVNHGRRTTNKLQAGVLRHAGEYFAKSEPLR